MIKYFLLITVISLLWHMSLSTSECSRTINAGVITFLCPATITDQELSLYDLTVAQLDSIVSILVTSSNAAVPAGPFTSIPPNICLLRNLQTIDFSSNQIVDVDPAGSFTKCLTNVISLRLQSNNIVEFPSTMIYNMPNLVNINFGNNQLTDVPLNAFPDISSIETIDFSNNQLTSFELWALEVVTSADFSYNQITTITNKYFFDTFLNTTNQPTIYLTGNGPTIDFTDVVYEMYNQCEEVEEWFVSEAIPDSLPIFTRKLSRINFGTTQISCSCAQHYFLSILWSSYGTLDDPNLHLPIETAMCVLTKQNSKNGGLFFNSSCASPQNDINSTADFSAVFPRLCKIYADEDDGNLTNPVNISAPSLNVSTYPHYETAFMNPGACFFTFTNVTTMNIMCTSDISNTLSRIPETLLSTTYMSDIQRVIFPSPISSLPSYLCYLPSGIIDLSYQAFTTLTDVTFPCLDSFTKVILSFNQLTSVNMSSGNFQNLSYLDLSSNSLTQLPYSILRPTPSSLRYLDLRNNSITDIDLYLYTLKNITVKLDNNPINSSNIVNPQNVTLDNSTSTVNITYPSSVTNSSIIIQDATVAILIACASFNSIRSFLLNLRSASFTVLLQCTCASFSLKQLYQANGLKITNDFICSVATQAQNFLLLTNASCPNATHFQTTLCNANTQISTDMTRMESLSNSVELTSTSFTIIITNSSSSTLNTFDQTQDTTFPEVTLTSTNSTIINSTTMISEGTTITAPPSQGTAPPLQGSGNASNSNNTGLIVGVVVGIGGFLILLFIIIAVILSKKAKAAAAATKKPISRAKVNGQAPGDSLSSRVQPRNLRAVKLAPITAQTSVLPNIPVATFVPTGNSSLLSNHNTTLRPSKKGFPIPHDSIRSPTDINPQYPPNSNALNNSSSFRPINNLSTHQIPNSQQPVQAPKPHKPRPNQLLNAGGDTRY